MGVWHMHIKAKKPFIICASSFTDMASGISGAVSGLASSGDFLGSTALDRYIRVHSIAALPDQAGGQQESRGEVLDKVYLASTPTAIVGGYHDEAPKKQLEDIDGDDDIWNDMAIAGKDDEDVGRKRVKR
jgi:ribosome biogenesis protein NSA1